MQPFEVTEIGRPEPWLIEAAASVGLDFSGLTHEITTYFVNHGIKRHGNAETEKAQGQVAVTPDDIERIPDIVKSPDCAVIGIKRHEEILIAYSRRFDDGTAIYYEEVLNSKKNKALRSKTLYKKIGTVSSETFLKIVANNAHTDVSGVKVVVGAGGRPGGEA
ncbi:MAG: hypothetical protein LBR96_01160 [Treponema sp.]|nr:hypothetical protein [Treponema sp.]